jgi:hypothetical protein
LVHARQLVRQIQRLPLRVNQIPGSHEVPIRALDVRGRGDEALAVLCVSDLAILPADLELLA